jgi:hypothetical protein
MDVLKTHHNKDETVQMCLMGITKPVNEGIKYYIVLVNNYKGRRQMNTKICTVKVTDDTWTCTWHEK